MQPPQKRRRKKKKGARKKKEERDKAVLENVKKAEAVAPIVCLAIQDCIDGIRPLGKHCEELEWRILPYHACLLVALVDASPDWTEDELM